MPWSSYWLPVSPTQSVQPHLCLLHDPIHIIYITLHILIHILHLLLNLLTSSYYCSICSLNDILKYYFTSFVAMYSTPATFTTISTSPHYLSLYLSAPRTISRVWATIMSKIIPYPSFYSPPNLSLTLTSKLFPSLNCASLLIDISSQRCVCWAPPSVSYLRSSTIQPPSQALSSAPPNPLH